MNVVQLNGVIHYKIEWVDMVDTILQVQNYKHF